MPRQPRLKGKGLYHHIYAWGNNRNAIFKDTKHYKQYLDFLKDYTSYYKIKVIAYALMKWHVHLFLFDPSGKVSELMKCLHGGYAKFFNRILSRVGHVFGERFNNRVVQLNNYGLWLSRYIHRQPIEAGLVKDPKDYPWISYRVYIGLAPKGFLAPEVILDQFGRGKDAYQRYQNFVLGVEVGPVDWDESSDLITGDEKFVKDIRGLINDKDDEEFDEDLLEVLSKRLKVKTDLLLNPTGRTMRRLRHKAFVMLQKKYGLSATQIARIFKVSTMAVVKVLKRCRY
ncbi:hypothetical protein BXT86_01475 [candidate division WOR-3 bacterium 4484_100]|uniref:Transposase IS200-like domain-containing protein n=1 Tax=candidate division WOR-3 bacterium 4484_100 TaxID=1936077 RepID=A0A1V4QG99_UNCW3|nr:MAG: hypothetical protein BXT86_01475 [candidate division WOR-3 bacterium 4484_100]